MIRSTRYHQRPDVLWRLCQCEIIDEERIENPSGSRRRRLSAEPPYSTISEDQSKKPDEIGRAGFALLFLLSEVFAGERLDGVSKKYGADRLATLDDQIQIRTRSSLIVDTKVFSG